MCSSLSDWAHDHVYVLDVHAWAEVLLHYSNVISQGPFMKFKPNGPGTPSALNISFIGKAET